MKKKLLCIIVLGVIMISIWGIKEIYLYNNPEIIITFSSEEADELYRSLPLYAITARSKFGQAARYDTEMKDWWIATNEVNLWLYNNFKKPMYVTSSVEIVNGTAKITYQGTATSLENENAEIYREVFIDFPVSANLEVQTDQE